MIKYLELALSQEVYEYLEELDQMNWSARGNVLNQYLRNTSIGTTVKLLTFFFELILSVYFTHVKSSQLVNKMCSHCLFPVVDKSGTSCYHLVTRLMRPTDW